MAIVLLSDLASYGLLQIADGYYIKEVEKRRESFSTFPPFAQPEDEAHLIRIQSFNVRSKMAALVSLFAHARYPLCRLSSLKFQDRAPEFNINDSLWPY